MPNHKDLIGGLFWFGMGLLLSFWATLYQIGSLIQPGPGFLPLVLGLLLILLSFILSDNFIAKYLCSYVIFKYVFKRYNYSRYKAPKLLIARNATDATQTAT